MWREAAEERQQLSDEADGFVKDLEGKADKLREAIETWAGMTFGTERNGGEAAPADLRSQGNSPGTRSQGARTGTLGSWLRTAGKYFHSRWEHRASISARISKLESWIRSH